ncbi:hypothetical protein [Burkholderia orbicola]|uniref:hypothetical protein n=1 Tax=Burkholderia orbicola TaxID=2978683 RepID=UPI0026527783|nr:hypothetical protein [Burkholderia orbicola]MDN7533844.1 hypothetical protein [Burkholderia orbicola]
MSRRLWKSFRPTSLTAALRGCKDYALDVHHLSVERIADRMAVTHDVLYKWLANGRMPTILIPTYELACGCHFVSTWLATSAGKLVVDMPKGRHAADAELMEVNSGCAQALQLLTEFYANPAAGNADATLNALRTHLEQIAYHHQNVARYTTPELEF